LPPPPPKNDEISPITRSPLTSSDSNRQSTTSHGLDFVYDGENELQKDRPVASRVSPDLVDAWGPSEYQNLVGAMITHLGDDLNATDEHIDSSSPSSSTDASYSVTTSDQEGSPKTKAMVAFTSTRVGRPSNFSITSVDPLHFLGITPTYQSGELLNACKLLSLSSSRPVLTFHKL
jgi:hypothetical protein